MEAISTIPTKDLRNIVLTTILTRGGKAVPADVYTAVQTHFPHLTKKAQKDLPYNVRWTRKTLVTEGLISSKVRGEWSLTAKGLQAARKSRE
jgi:hypothetical protein